jgi:hypothetical protein
VDGTLIPTRDHAVAAWSENYRYSTDLQLVAQPPRARRAILTERHRPWSADETAQYRAQVLQTRRDLDQVWSPEYSRRLREIIDLAAPALPAGERASLTAAADLDPWSDALAHEQDPRSATAQRTVLGQAEPAAVDPSGLEPVGKANPSGLEPVGKANPSGTADVSDADQQVPTGTKTEEVDAAVQRAVDAMQIVNEHQRADARQRESDEYLRQQEADQDRERAAERGTDEPTAVR